MGRSLAAVVALVFVGALACSEKSAVDPVPAPPSVPAQAGLIVSESHAAPSSNNIVGERAPLASASSEVAYVSAEPRTFPTGRIAYIRNVAGDVVSRNMVDGGFDPVAVAAVTGDNLVLMILSTDGTLVSFTLTVPKRRPPVIVRTNPSKGRTDVALTQVITVVFSEPVDASTVSAASIALFDDAGQVSATPTLSSDGLSVTLTPSLALATTYTLKISTQIRDLSGDQLDSDETVSFTTVASTNAGPLDRIIVTPSVVTLAAGSTQQFIAVGKDASGNVVPISPNWNVTQGAGTITSSGLFTAGPSAGVFMWSVEATVGDAIPGDATVAITQPSATREFVAVTAGGQHTCALTKSGTAFCWGDNTHGALGNGTTASSSTPVPVSVARPFYVLSAGGTHTCGTTPTPWMDNYVNFCWGGNASGQLGDGTQLDRTSPQPLDSSWIDGAIISAGSRHTCMLDLWAWTGGRCWGANDKRQLGDGTGISRMSPVNITQPGQTHYEIVTSGGSHTCAEISGYLYGTFAWYCWGDNSNGQLGDGTTGEWADARIVGGGMSFAVGGVSAGGRHTCGVRADGTTYCWGVNSNGQLGDGTTTQHVNPTLVPGGFQFVAVSAGENHTCAITADGKAYCWGLNTNGQLGDGTTATRLTPVPVAGGIRFAIPTFPRFGNNGTLSAGARHTCGVTISGDIFCWGANDHGQLGNAATQESSVPVKVLE